MKISYAAMPEPGQSERDALILAMCKAHDREEAAQMGEPSPWEVDNPADEAEFVANRTAAMAEALDVALATWMPVPDEYRARPMTNSPTNAAGDLVTDANFNIGCLYGIADAVAVTDPSRAGDMRLCLSRITRALAASSAHATGAMREGWGVSEIADAVIEAVTGSFDEGWQPRSAKPAVEDVLRAALSSPAQEGEATPVRTDADGVREAAAVCHDEQMTVWTHEMAVHLSTAGFLRDNLNYEDWMSFQAAISDELRDIIKAALTHPERIKPEGETGPAVAEPIAWRVDDLTAAGKTCGVHALFSDYERVEQYVERNGARSCKVTPLYAALTVPSPSERDQHQGETLSDRLRGMFDMGVPSTDAFNHLTPAGFRLLRAAHDAFAALSTPEAVPVADKREGEAASAKNQEASRVAASAPKTLLHDLHYAATNQDRTLQQRLSDVIQIVESAYRVASSKQKEGVKS